MYINNPNAIKNKFKVQSFIGKIIESQFGISPISKDDNYYYFTKNSQTNSLPMYCKIWMKEVDC
jgi:hypothetical protein